MVKDAKKGKEARFVWGNGVGVGGVENLKLFLPPLSWPAQPPPPLRADFLFRGNIKAGKNLSRHIPSPLLYPYRKKFSPVFEKSKVNIAARKIPSEKWKR